MTSYKLILWDWLGTLYSNDILHKSRLQNLKKTGSVNSSLDFDNLSFRDGLQIKSKLKVFKGCNIPFTWFLVHCFTQIGALQVVISNGLESSILSELRSFNPFDLILTAEKFEPKPDLAMPLHAMDVLNIHDKDAILFIGDSLIDQKVASDLGVNFFRINDPYEGAYELSKELGFI